MNQIKLVDVLEVMDRGVLFMPNEVRYPDHPQWEVYANLAEKSHNGTPFMRKLIGGNLTISDEFRAMMQAHRVGHSETFVLRSRYTNGTYAADFVRNPRSVALKLYKIDSSRTGVDAFGQEIPDTESGADGTSLNHICGALLTSRELQDENDDCDCAICTLCRDIQLTDVQLTSYGDLLQRRKKDTGHNRSEFIEHIKKLRKNNVPKPGANINELRTGAMGSDGMFTSGNNERTQKNMDTESAQRMKDLFGELDRTLTSKLAKCGKPRDYDIDMSATYALTFAMSDRTNIFSIKALPGADLKSLMEACYSGERFHQIRCVEFNALLNLEHVQGIKFTKNPEAKDKDKNNASA